MKKIKYLFLLLIGILFFTNCEELETLKRDNPLDEKNKENIIEGVSVKFDSYSIIYDNNNDKIANKGETVYLKVNLTNKGKSLANGVKATFSTTSSYVSGFSPTSQIDYGNISSGVIQGYGSGITSGSAPNYSQYTLKFTVSTLTPNNTKIPINISIVDESGNTWTDNFEVTVESTQAEVAFDSYSIIYDNNNDKIANKGETVYLKVNLTNKGKSLANGVKATFSTTSSYVSGFSPTSQIDYGNISSGVIQGYGSGITSGSAPNYSQYTLKFTISTLTPNNTKIPINISIVDESGNTWTDNFEVTVENM